MTQAPLFRPTILARFHTFHADNPHIYGLLRNGARRLRTAGWEHYGIAALWEGLRYESAVHTTGDDFKLNNSYRALYARMLMENEPELRGFFSTRTRSAA